MSIKSALVGSQGVFETAAELARREWVASLTLGDAPRTDLLAQQTGGGFLPAAIQVKTRTRGDFHLNISDLSPQGANEWVVLVSLEISRGGGRFCVVPRNHICAVVLALAAIFDRKGKAWPRKLIGVKEFEAYSERWDLMNEKAEDAPWSLLAPWVTAELSEHPQAAFPFIRRAA
jgi:hypothetical protein